MKKILSILVLGGLFITTSCDNNLLEPFTPGAVTEDVAIQTSGDLSTLLQTAYGVMTPSSEIEFNSVFTDEVGIGYGNGGQGLGDYYSFLLNTLSGAPNGIWDTHYATLAYVNRVIKYADQITAVDAADQLEINKIKAEALTLRAYCHNQLLAYFSTNPKDMTALGVMISNDVYPSDYYVGRSTNADVYALIDQDLTDAIALFDTTTGAVSNMYANKYFAIATQARSHALRGDYTGAETYADDVIANSGLSLATFSNYKKVFHTDDNDANSEVIFKLRQLSGDAKIGGIWASVNATVTGSPFYEMGRQLFNTFDTTNLPSATSYTITAVAGSTLTIPGHTMQVGDEFVPQVTYPTGASATSPTALQAGKIYYVKSVSGNNFTLQQTLGTAGTGTTAVSFSPNATGLSIAAKSNFGDVRFDVNLHYSSIVNYNYQTVVDYRNTDKLAIRKYPGRTDSGNLVNDVKISRLSEMYFIKAEARVAQNDLNGAANVMKTLKDARHNRVLPAPTYATATDAWKDILRERKMEFAYEGYRFIDLKRLGTLANEGISRDGRDCEVNGACSLPVTDYRFALPIPADEINANSAIKGQQNPNY